MIKRRNQFTRWLKYDAKDCGIMQPPLKAQRAVHFLKDYLLGEDWYVINPVNTEQCNSQIVHEILMKYSRAYRKEYKQECRKFYSGRN